VTTGAHARFMQGNEAAVEGTLAAGLGFYAGYPITPTNEIAEALAQRLPQSGGVFIQMEDEIASLAAVIGASLGGVKAATATSGPGFSLMQENIGYAVTAEVPCVIINVQRAGPSTGQPTRPSQGDVMQARWGTHGDHPIIVLSPSSVLETYELAVRSFNLAERYRTPVILLMDEVVAHMREKVVLPEEVEVVERAQAEVPPEWYWPYEAGGDVPPLVPFGEGYRYHVTGLFHDRAGFPTGRLDEIQPWLDRLFRKIEGNVEEIVAVEGEWLEGAEVAVVAYGASARSARHGVRRAREAGRRVGLLKLITLWPFAERAVRELSARVSRIVVVEMNRGQMLREVERTACGQCEVVGVNRADGQMVDPRDILGALT